MKINKIRIIVFVCLISFSCSKKLVSNINDKHKILTDQKINPCEVLNNLADTSSYVKNGITPEYFQYLVVHFSTQSGLITKRQVCDFTGCYYPSKSMEKSLFKDDLVDWMRFYNCSDTTKLIQSDTGLYNKQELEIIRNRLITVPQYRDKYTKYLDSFGIQNR